MESLSSPVTKEAESFKVANSEHRLLDFGFFYTFFASFALFGAPGSLADLMI